MTDLVSDKMISPAIRRANDGLSLEPSAALKKRNAAEQRFKVYGRVAIFLSLAFLAVMLVTIFRGGAGAFTTTEIGFEITFDEQVIDPAGTRDPNVLRGANYKPLISRALAERFPNVTTRSDTQALYKLMSTGAVYQLEEMVRENPNIIGTTQMLWLPASGDANLLASGKVDESLDESLKRLSTDQTGWFETLKDNGQVRQSVNRRFFTNGDSREPELAGIRGALFGSFFTLMVSFAISFPLGVGSAVYLEEFSRKNRLTDFIEVNINNLAAVPSIVFGLLGLSIFLNVFGLPRSSPLVGGMVLALMTLPTIIIASRASLRAVPPSIRQAARGLGASDVQTAFHHSVPLAMPGILTGTIIGMAQALGQTAPLLMIGMVAFVVDVPQGFVDVATALPVQIFLWADSPEKGFQELTSAAIIVLLVFLIVMNLLAIFLRRKLERRW